MTTLIVPPLSTTFAPDMNLYMIRKDKIPMAWNIQEKSTMVTFKKVEHALLIASMTESHYKSNKEWPIDAKFSFHKQVIPTILDIKQHDYKRISRMCSLWGINLLILNEIEEVSPLKYNFIGELEKFDEVLDEHKDFFEYLYIN